MMDSDRLLDDLAQVADTQSLQLAIGAEPTPARLRIAAVLAEHQCSSPCRMLTALRLYDRALSQLGFLLDAATKGAPLPQFAQDSVDLAQAGFLEVTGEEPLSLHQLSPIGLAGNPFRQSVMCG
jgi:hypothetical protein